MYALQDCHSNGDVNRNGSVTAADALLVFQQALSLAELDACRRGIADVFPGPVAADGDVTASDAFCILRKAFGLPSCLDILQPFNGATQVDWAPEQNSDSRAGDGPRLAGGALASTTGDASVEDEFTALAASMDARLAFLFTVLDRDDTAGAEDPSATGAIGIEAFICSQRRAPSHLRSA